MLRFWLIVAGMWVGWRGIDDVILADPPQRLRIDSSAVERWVFVDVGDRSAAEPWLNERLQREIRLLRRAIRLTDDQRAKLELAGRGDITRFFEDVASLTLQSRHLTSEEELQRLFKGSSNMRILLATSVHGRSSLFEKTMSSILDADQRSRLP